MCYRVQKGLAACFSHNMMEEDAKWRFSHTNFKTEESVRQNENRSVIFTRLCGMPAHVCVFEKMKLKLLFLQTVLHLIVWYAGPGQNNNANFDTDVEAGGASEDENQVRKMVRRMLMMVMVNHHW